MKTLFYFLFVINLSWFVSCGSKEITLKIDKKVSNIESNLSKYKRDSLYFQHPEKQYLNGSYTAYLDKNTVVKLIEYAGDEGFIITNSYYFEKGKLIFMLVQSIDNEETSEEKFLYFEDSNLVNALHKVHKANNKQSIKSISTEPDTAILSDIRKSTRDYFDLTKTAAENYRAARNQK